MNKLHILCAIALGLGFASCDEVEECTGMPQTNPQEAPFGVDAITVTPDNASTFDLGALNAAGAPAVLAQTALSGAPEGYSLSFDAEFATTDDFADAKPLPTAVAAEGALTASADELQALYYAVTHDPAEATVYIRYAAYAVTDGTTRVRMGGSDYFFGPYAYTVKPFDAAKEIADGYTLELSATDDFSAPVAVPFNHSAASPYDDPKFSVTATYSAAEFAAGLKWRVVSSTGVVYGPAGAADATGDLMEGAPAGTVTVASPLLMEIDMLADTYKYKQAYEGFYTPGSSNGWNAGASQMITTTDYVHYSGLVVVESGDGFKLNPDLGWEGHDMGLKADLTKTVLDDGTIVFEGVADGGNNIKTEIAKGLFYVEFALDSKAVKLTYLSTLGIIGGFNGWAESIAMQPSADYLTWTAPATEFPAGCEWKVRANDGWAYSWGTDADALVFNGGNLVTDQAGTYVVTLNIGNTAASVVLTQQ